MTVAFLRRVQIFLLTYFLNVLLWFKCNHLAMYDITYRPITISVSSKFYYWTRNVPVPLAEMAKLLMTGHSAC